LKISYEGIGLREAIERDIRRLYDQSEKDSGVDAANLREVREQKC
jgi:hypothetical protein